nr:MAG TPA: hypothetical protein [Caudoviricetes sp.]
MVIYIFSFLKHIKSSLQFYSVYPKLFLPVVRNTVPNHRDYF